MKKFLESKIFVFVSTFLTLIIGGIAGWLLGYQPNTRADINGFSAVKDVRTKYVFQIKTACGYWLLAIIITFIVLLLCITIRKQYMNHTTKTEMNN